MSIIHDSRFKITTIWPELVNKQIKAVDIRLRESQFINRDNQLLVNGIIQRRVSYLDFDGRSRKTEDRLQFEISVNNIESPTEPDFFQIELQHDYFIFQPRRIGENQAIFEHGFGVIVNRHKKESAVDVKSDTLAPMLARIILEQGKGAVTLSQPVFFTEMVVEPVTFHGEACFTGNSKELPLISGVLNSKISFLTHNKTLSETKMEIPFHFLEKIPELSETRKFQIKGSIIDWVWLFDNNLQTWRLEYKLNYQWRIFEEKEVICIAPPQTLSENGLFIEAPLRLTELKTKLPKSISLSVGNLRPVELKLVRQKCGITARQKGLLAKFELDVEIYAFDEQGREAYLHHPVTWEELIPLNIHIASPDNIIPVLQKLDIQLINFSVEMGTLQINMVNVSQIGLYQNHQMVICESNDPTAVILGKIIKDQKNFSLLGNTILQLRSKPVSIQRFEARNITIKSQNREGWLRVKGQIQLGVAYFDEKHCLREDTFPVFFRENFLWDKLQVPDEVKIKSRLEYDSYALHSQDPLKLNYRFLLTFTAECFYEREIKVSIPSNLSDNGPDNDHSNNDFLGLLTQKPLIDRYPADYWVPDDIHCSLQRFEFETDIPLVLGKAQDIENGRFIIGYFSYRNESELVLIEGNLNGELDYWDSEGYLRSEPVSCEFWKCIRSNFKLNIKNTDLIPELHQLRFIPVKTSFWRKGKVKITFQIEIKQIIEGEAMQHESFVSGQREL